MSERESVRAWAAWHPQFPDNDGIMAINFSKDYLALSLSSGMPKSPRGFGSVPDWYDRGWRIVPVEIRRIENDKI